MTKKNETLRQKRNNKRLDRTITPWRKAMIHVTCNNDEKWILRRLGPALLLLRKLYQTSNRNYYEWVAKTYGYETT